MFERFKKEWKELRRGSPGRRFQEYYRRRQEARRGRRRALSMGIGVGLSIAGAVLLMIPGPGIPVLALGLAGIARESARVARALDVVEVQVRRSVEIGTRLWSESPVWAKAAVALAAALAVGAAAVGIYEVALG